MSVVKLFKIRDFLISQHLHLSANSRDGRLNSAVNEDEIFNLIAQNFQEILHPKKRDWFDFAYEEYGKFYPVNIKITELSTDNLNCKLGIYYALTGEIPPFDNQCDWGKFLEILSKNIKENDKDYYFLVLNKNNLRDIFCIGLKQMQNLTPNGNNLPFQANWSNNKIPQHRNYEQAKELILQNLGKSFKLRARVYEQFLEFFPQFKDRI